MIEYVKSDSKIIHAYKRKGTVDYLKYKEYMIDSVTKIICVTLYYELSDSFSIIVWIADNVEAKYDYDYALFYSWSLLPSFVWRKLFET